MSNGVGGADSMQQNAERVEAKHASKSATTVCEILDGSGYAPMLEILDLMDLAAGRTAYQHVGGADVVTASFEDVIVRAPVPRGSMLQVSAEVVATGRSSVLLRVEAKSECLAERRFVRCISAYATFVAVGAKRNVPALAGAEPAGLAARTRLAEERRAFLAVAPAPAEARACGAQNGTSEAPMRAADAVVRLQKQYLPRHRNFGGMVFGGDLMETTARLASYAARRLGRGKASANVAAIKYFSFVHPIQPMNMWQLVARVAAVVGALVFVEVSASINRALESPSLVHSHDALYAVLLGDDNGVPVECPVAIDYTDADDALLTAHHRALLWMTLDQNVLRLAPVQGTSK